MSETFNFYCDESCHLENDGQEVMTLGALWCPLKKREEICIRLREIKRKHKIQTSTEVKWVKVSPSRLQFYLEWIDYFFDDDDLHFRGVVIPSKSKLDHTSRNQTHDDWYYKMLYTLLQALLKPENCHRIYIDKKDTRSHSKAQKLRDVLASSQLDFDRKIIERVQPISSHESELIQLCDLLIGAVGYTNRSLRTSQAKLDLSRRVQQRSGLSLTRSTLLKAVKFNLLRWEGSGSNE